MTRTVWLLLLFIKLFSVAAWNLSLIPTEERLQNRRSGDNFLIVCKVKDFDGAASDVSIEWYREGKLIPRFGSIMTIERTYSNQLMINRPTISNGGKYTCITEINGEKKEVSADISFVDPPKFVNVKQEQHPEEGTRAEIVCEVEGSDQVEIFWQFNGVTLDDTSQRSYEFSENNNVLYIPSFTAKRDDGIYNCNAAQYSSFETLSINVTGYARPVITVFDVPNENRGIEGHTIELKCGAIGKPKPTYKWFFENDELPIVRSDKHNIDEGLLIIESLNFEDAGNYKCIANNSVGFNERHMNLSVFLKPKVELKSEYVVKEGDDVEIICSYDSEGQVNAKFLSGSHEFSINQKSHSQENDENSDSNKNSKDSMTEETVEVLTEIENHENDRNIHSTEENDDRTEAISNENVETDEEESESKKLKRFADDFNTNERISVRTEDNKLILSIKKVLLEDAADYICSVTNGAGTTNKVSQIGIIHPPTLRHYTGANIRSFDGNTVTIYCDASAVPSPKWYWYKDGKEVEANGASIKIDSQSSFTKLTLENFETNNNYGVYVCHADNGVGKLEKKIEVIRVVKPETPSGTDCKKIIYPNYGKCSFDTDIYEDQTSRPQTINVLIAKLEGMESDFDWNDAEKKSVKFDTDITIPDLKANTQYVIKLQAVNEAGTSDFTNEISLETTDPWAPESPISLSMECSEYCVLSWEAPNDHGSSLLKYRITVQEMVKHSTSKLLTNTKESLDVTTNSESLENSKFDDETSEIHLEENISEEQDDGVPTFSEHSTSSTESVEHIEKILPTDPTPKNEYGGEEKMLHGSQIILEVDAGEQQIQLLSVKPHSYYKISVAAINAVGQGESSEIEHQTDDSPTKYGNDDGTLWWIIAILAAVALLLLLVDIACFLINRCGLISCICFNICGRTNNAKKNDVENGRNEPESSRLLDSSGTR